jgi:hypothetical protein
MLYTKVPLLLVFVFLMPPLRSAPMLSITAGGAR